MPTARVAFKHSTAWLSTEFGQELAMKVFKLTLEELEALVGRYKRGERKGLLKGKIDWYKVTHGGWYKTGKYDFDSMQGNGFVVPFVGLCFCYGIYIPEFRKQPTHKLGFDFNEHDEALFRADLFKKCAHRSGYKHKDRVEE